MNEEERLCAAVDEFAEAMKKRLISKMRKGYTGWDNPDCRWGIMQGARTDFDNIKHGKLIPKHCVDLANRLMMIWRMDKAPTPSQGESNKEVG